MNTTKCTACGQQVRDKWVRCPRCRALLAEQVGEARAEIATASAPTAGGNGVVIGASIAALVMVGVIAAVVKANLPPAALPAPSTSTRPIAATTTVAARTPRATSAREVKTYAAADSMRAGSAAYAQGDLALALSEFEAAVAATPDDAEARNNLAQVLVRRGRMRDALPHLDAAVRLEPNKWNYRFNRARVYGQLNRFEEAAAEYATAARLFPEDYATHFNLGLTQMRLKQYAEAANSLEQAVALAPGESSFFVPLGTAYIGAERPDRARATFEKFLTLFPDDTEAPKVRDLLEALTEAGR